MISLNLSLVHDSHFFQCQMGLEFCVCVCVCERERERERERVVERDRESAVERVI